MQENSDHNIGSYVNLLTNPERYTGYSGPSARRVWQSIIEENCFGGSEDSCLEKRVFFRYRIGENIYICISDNKQTITSIS